MIAWRKKPRDQRKKKRRRQKLRFTPTAWAKLRFLRDVGETEVGGFGISSVDDPLLVEDFQLVEQSCTLVTVVFDDMAVADFFEQQVDLGRRPEEFARIWIHTHPGSCPLPSGTDEETFDRCFSAPDWAVMFILARNEATYARLRFNVGPLTTKRLGVAVDYRAKFSAADHGRWLSEYEDSVQVHDPFASRAGWNDAGSTDPWAVFAEPGDGDDPASARAAS
jgi:proteasome lid subunit RPN8/RPN11